MKSGFGQGKHAMDIVMKRVDRRFSPEVLVADHGVHNRIEAAARGPMAPWVAKRPLDQLRVTKTVADHADAPMLVENEVGRGRQDVLLGNDCSPRCAQPALDLAALLGRKRI